MQSDTDFRETAVEELSRLSHCEMRLDSIEERFNDLEAKFEEERQWWHERLEWFIDYYRAEWVEMQDKLASERSVENLVKAIEM